VSDAHVRRVQAQFGASAAAYVSSPLHAAGEDLDRLLAWGAARRPDRVLDVATGGGHTALALAGVARHVVACDVTEPMLLAAREHLRGRGAANVEFVAGDAGALPFGDGTFDVVTCRTAAHHFADVSAAVRQIHRVLRPGGTLLLQDILGHDDPAASAFLLEVERRRDPSHVRSYRTVEWKAFLRAVGLTVMEDVVIRKIRHWNEWTGRMRMTPESRRDLEAFVRRAPEPCRAAFDFEVTDDAVLSFIDRQILLRAERD
jgi:ubiquinone/menaquinone biosynthesis C-methylase UbiE